MECLGAVLAHHKQWVGRSIGLDRLTDHRCRCLGRGLRLEMLEESPCGCQICMGARVEGAVLIADRAGNKAPQAVGILDLGIVQESAKSLVRFGLPFSQRDNRGMVAGDELHLGMGDGRYFQPVTGACRDAVRTRDPGRNDQHDGEKKATYDVPWCGRFVTRLQAGYSTARDPDNADIPVSKPG